MSRVKNKEAKHLTTDHQSGKQVEEKSIMDIDGPKIDKVLIAKK